MDTFFLGKYGLTGAKTVALLQQLQRIKLVVFDVDGVLTDGRLCYGAQGEMLKCFNVKDGVALKLLPKWGIQVAVISAKGSESLQKRMQDLGVQHFYPNSHNKKEVLSELLSSMAVSFSDVAYVGDDVIDLQVMPLVGLPLCPYDAHILVQRHCEQILRTKGGNGVAREVCDLILASRMSLEAAYEIAEKPEFETLSK